MADAMEEVVDINHPDTQIEATNKSLNEFVAEHVKGFVEDPERKSLETPTDGEKGPLGEKDEETKEVLGEKDEKKEEKVDEKVEEKKDEKEEKGEKEEEKVDEKEDEEKEEGLVEGKPVPYDRFQEVVKERTEFKQRFEQVQPVVENYNRITDFCRQNTITPEQFEKAMRVQALLNTNPAEALKELTPIVESLQGFVGNKLPEDLQKKVDEDKMSIEDAREMAKLRAQVNYRETMAKRNNEFAQQTAQERAVATVTQAAKDWEVQKRKTDPDYAPVAEGKPDGLWEDVRDKFAALLNQRDSQGNFLNSVHSAQEMVALQERAYKAVKDKWTSRLSPKRPAIRRSISSNGGETHHEERTIEGAKTMKDAIAIRLKERGVVAV